MTVTISQQPQASSAVTGNKHYFSVTATGSGPLTYQWYLKGLIVEGANASYFEPVATKSNSFSNVKVIVGDGTEFVESATVQATTLTRALGVIQGGATSSTVNQHSLLWNFKNDTFTWKDSLTEQENTDGEYENYDIDNQVYGFMPGFQQRWEDYQQGAVLESTWEDAAALPWFQTFSKGKDKEMLVLSNGQLFRAEGQRNRVGSNKKYYVERTQLDFDGLAPEFRSGKVKQTKRFVMDVQGDQRMISRATTNKVDMYVGWSMNLMDDPNYKKANSFNLQATDFGGSYKVDYRSSGRYMGLYFDMTEANQLSFTGGEIDLAQTSGR